MRNSRTLRVLRCVASAGLSVAIVAAASGVRHVNHTTVALLLVLLIVGLSIQWGWMEALAASLAGGLAFDYFFLPPRGFSLEAPEDWISLGAFLLTATLTGHLAARASRYRAEAERRRDEIARLYKLGNALLDSEGAETWLERIADHIVKIFQAQEAALFDQSGGRLLRSGAGADCIPEERLREVAVTGDTQSDGKSEYCIVPIRRSGNLVGSLGIAGPSLSRSVVEAIAERIGVALARAYTARESMAAELARRSQNLKSAVLDALAHEIKGPLATVKVSVTTLLSQQPGSTAQQRELLTIADDEISRIEHWIDDATQVSRIRAGDLRLKKKPGSMRQVTARAVEGLGPLASGRQIDVQIPKSLPDAVFDAGMIEKVIRLLLDNALKYSPPGSPIGVSADFTGAEVILSITDRGYGVADREKESIFEKHHRGSAAGHAQGTGLGLASAKVIMEAHGGEIWVTGAPGCGSIFHISLPATMELWDGRFEDS